MSFQLALFHDIATGAIEIPSDKQNQPMFKKC